MGSWLNATEEGAGNGVQSDWMRASMRLQHSLQINNVQNGIYAGVNVVLQ